MIHSLDISVPLGALRCATDGAMRIVLDDLTEGGVHAHFGTAIQGRSFHATDIGWSFGNGTSLTGTAAEVALGLCGRSLTAREAAPRGEQS